MMSTDRLSAEFRLYVVARSGRILRSSEQAPFTLLSGGKLRDERKVRL